MNPAHVGAVIFAMLGRVPPEVDDLARGVTTLSGCCIRTKWVVIRM